MSRTPHRLTISQPAPIILNFWTAQAAQIAMNASQYEREGKLDKAADGWHMAMQLSPADNHTRSYCLERTRICGMSVHAEAVA